MGGVKTDILFRSTKRKQAHAGPLFAEQAVLAQKRKMDRMGSKSEYVSKFLLSLAMFTGSCAFCTVYGRSMALKTPHTIMACPTLKHDVPGIDVDTYLAWKGMVKYKPKKNGSVCYFCHIPQVTDALHATIQRNAGACKHQDVLAPIGYAIFHKRELRAMAEERFKVEWSAGVVPINDYAVWCCGRSEEEDSPTNLSALFLWHCSQM